MKRLHAIVEGRVQGVGFRQWTCRKAQALGLTGWVRNLEDGRVELVAEGGQDEVFALLESLRQGPPLARVSHVTQELTDLTQAEFTHFELRRDLE